MEEPATAEEEAKDAPEAEKEKGEGEATTSSEEVVPEDADKNETVGLLDKKEEAAAEVKEVTAVEEEETKAKIVEPEPEEEEST